MCGIARPSPSLHPRIPAHRLQAALGGGVKSAFTTHPITATLVSMETEPPSVGKQDCVHNTGRGPNGCRLTPGRGHSRWHDARMLEELVIVEGNFYGKKKCCHLSTTFRIIRPIRALPSICANNNNNKKTRLLFIIASLRGSSHLVHHIYRGAVLFHCPDLQQCNWLLKRIQIQCL